MPKYGDYPAVTTLQNGDLILIYDQSTGTTKKLDAANLLAIGGTAENDLIVDGANVGVTGDIILPGQSGYGIRRAADPTTGVGTFGWKDLIGTVTPRASAPNAATLNIFHGGQVRGWAFAAGDRSDNTFHMPHDWVPGTDLYIHVHWGHNGTAISGSIVFNFYTTFARGFNQAGGLGNFGAEVNTTLTVSTPDIATVPQYRHRTDEIQLSAASPTGNQIDTDSLETDSILLINTDVTTIPTITGGSPNQPYVFTLDLHYMSMSAGTTVNKAPSFYA